MSREEIVAMIEETLAGQKRIEKMLKQLTQAPHLGKGRGTVAECREYAKERGFPAMDGEDFFDQMESCGWTRNGKPMRDWQARFRNWERGGAPLLPETGRQSQDPPGHPGGRNLNPTEEVMARMSQKEATTLAATGIINALGRDPTRVSRWFNRVATGITFLEDAIEWARDNDHGIHDALLNLRQWHCTEWWRGKGKKMESRHLSEGIRCESWKMVKEHLWDFAAQEDGSDWELIDGELLKRFLAHLKTPSNLVKS